MAKKIIIHVLLIIAVFTAASALAIPSAQASAPVESALDSLISKAARDRIDRRKDMVSRLALDAGVSVGAYTGSREVDLRGRDTPVKQQYPAWKCHLFFPTRVGTCSAFGLAAAVENAMGGDVDLSERHLWSQYCIPSSEAAIMALSRKSGIVEESKWPGRKWLRPKSVSGAPRFKLFEYRSLEDDMAAIVETLDRGNPVYFALNTPSEMWQRKAVIGAASGSTGGGHAVAVVGYRLDETVEGGGYLLIKNSWGAQVGENGYQWLSMGYCARKGNYCLAWSIDRAGRN